MELIVGVLGATGYIGTPYREEIRDADGARIVALCARRRDRLEAAGEKDDAELVTDDWRKVIDHPDVNFVVIATPDALHHEAVMACAEAGKHVLCEKPVAANARQAFAMWSAYRDAPLRLAHFVPFWTRWVSVFEEAREMVRSGALGDIRGVIYRWHNPRPAAMPLTWRDNASLSAGGSIADVGSHAYDTVRWILGEDARRVLTHAATITPAKADIGDVNLDEALEWGREQDPPEAPSRRGGTYDYAGISWEFEGGAVGMLVLSHATYFRKGMSPELELHGTEASLGVNRITSDLTIVRPDAEPELLATVPDSGSDNRFEKHVFPAVRAFVNEEGETDHPDLETGWRAQLFTDAAQLSAQRGGWVELEEIRKACEG